MKASESTFIKNYKKVKFYEILRLSGREVLSAVWSVHLNEEERLRMCDNNVLIATREV